MRDARSGGGKRRPLPPKVYGRQQRAAPARPQTVAHAMAHGFNPGTPGPYATVHDQRAARMEAHYHSPQTVGGLLRQGTKIATGVDPAHPLADPVALGMAVLPWGRFGAAAREFAAARRIPMKQLVASIEAESMAEGAGPLHPIEKALIYGSQAGSVPFRLRLPRGGGPRNNGDLNILAQYGLKPSNLKGGPRNNADLMRLYDLQLDRTFDAGRPYGR